MTDIQVRDLGILFLTFLSLHHPLCSQSHPVISIYKALLSTLASTALVQPPFLTWITAAISSQLVFMTLLLSPSHLFSTRHPE